MVGWRKCAKFRFYLAAFTAPALDLQHAGASAPSQHAPLAQHASVPQHSPVAQQAASSEQQAPLPQQALLALALTALGLQHSGASAPTQHASVAQHDSVPQHSPVAQQAASGEQQAPLPQQALLALALTVMAPWQQDESASTSMPSASWGQGATAPEQPPPWQEPDS